MYFTMPSEAFSALAEQLHKVYKDRDEYLEVITDVMPFLRAEDFAPKSYQGTLITPLAEQIEFSYGCFLWLPSLSAETAGSLSCFYG